MTQNNKLIALLEYTMKGWHLFPIKPNQKEPLGEAVPHGFEDASNNPRIISKWCQQYPNANFGLNLKKTGLVCIDVDSYKKDCAFNHFISDKYLPDTLTQHSASGGTHYLFRANPEHNYPGVLCPGVDIKYNGYILLSPSTFKNNPYKWANDLPIADAPEWLSTNGRSIRPAPNHIHSINSTSVRDIQCTIDTYGWHNTLLRLTASMVSQGKSDGEIHNITDLLTQPGYQIEQTHTEVQKMVSSARAKGFNDFAKAHDTFIAPRLTSDTSETIANHDNIFNALNTDEDWSHIFAFDEFTNKKMLLKQLPGRAGNPTFFKPRELKDSDTTYVLRWLNRNGYLRVSKLVVIDCIQALCEENTISPVRHYLEGLQFNPSTERHQLSTWMQDYLGVYPKDDDEKAYVQAVSRLSLIQGVARALNPGCKADSVPILEGGQGIGKSTAIRELHGADWFGDALPPMSSKDASDYVRGKWGIEFAELAFQQKAEVEAQKAFISRREERFRPAYGREEICYPRRCVFWGTTNRNDYIKDDTGNRRFLPIRVNQVDIEGLKANRDKLWAEAVNFYKQGEEYWLSDALLQQATQQANERVENDPWVELVQSLPSKITEGTLKQICLEIFEDIKEIQITTQMTRRLSTCLLQAGWKREGKYSSGPQRNQARFIRSAEDIADTKNNAHEENDF